MYITSYVCLFRQHDKLKEQLEKRKDNKLLAKEVEEMEEAIRDKEKEIKALVHLYNEVLLCISFS